MMVLTLAHIKLQSVMEARTIVLQMGQNADCENSQSKAKEGRWLESFIPAVILPLS